MGNCVQDEKKPPGNDSTDNLFGIDNGIGGWPLLSWLA